MGERCMRCGIGSGLVFQGGNKFICTNCLDDSQEGKGRQSSTVKTKTTATSLEIPDSLLDGLWGDA